MDDHTDCLGEKHTGKSQSEVRGTNSSVGSRQAMGQTVGAHSPLLVCADAQIAQRLGPTEQYKLPGSILRKVGNRILLIHCAGEQLAGASKTTALMAYSGQLNADVCRCIPHIFILAANARAEPIRGFQSHLKAHARDCGFIP
jgi:hypothetical protein